jgi:hypothetical protein
MVAIVAVLGLTAFAGAATHTINDPKHDLLSTMLPTGVKSADVDITKATAGKSAGKIQMTMTVDGRIAKAIGHKDTPPEFFIKVGASHYFGVYPTDGHVVDLTKGHKAGSATMTEPNSHKVSTEFNPSAIGGPSSYRWYALIGDCTVYDRAPDTGFTNGKRC